MINNASDIQKEIENVRQNNPELVIQDLKALIDPAIVQERLLMRGINKWLRVRRLLIQLKDRWKNRISLLEDEARQLRAQGKNARATKLMGRRAELIDCRQQIRALCHSPRYFIWESLHTREVGLPDSFPQHPHKRWFRWYDRQQQVQSERNHE